MLNIITTFIFYPGLTFSSLSDIQFFYFCPEAKFPIWSLNKFLVEQSLLLFLVFYI